MNAMLLILCLSCLLSGSLSVTPAVPLVSLSYSSGAAQKLLNELREQVLHYGPCWQDAVEKLETSCVSLTEDSQHRLALAFTSCFVQKMGHPGYSCAADEHVDKCTDFKALSRSPHLGSYSTFFTHAQVICSFLQQQRWQGTTLRVINALSESSVELSNRLTSLNDVMALTRADQDRLQEYTRKALQENQKLTDKISSQGSSLSIMLDQIHYVNTIIAGHASTLSSFAFFVGAVLISFLLTTPPQTRHVRLWLLLLFTANLLIELAILQWALEIAGLSHEYFRASNPISFRLSLCRRVFCCLSFVVYMYKAITYRSPEERSHGLLLEVSSTVNSLDLRLQKIETALTSAAARVYKTYDNIDGFRTSPMRFRETTPLGAPPRTNIRNHLFEHKQQNWMTLNKRDSRQPAATAQHDDNSCIPEKADHSKKVCLEEAREASIPKKQSLKNSHEVHRPLRRSSRIKSPP
ncbi:uncharacterized protein LOC111269015 [Varroa jacobsoni]|uniref:uncharacterized protein LOC111269015 n=1 Tax=Varroa jacobsoni TaxID=62625 RepID=UPI000BFA16C5|nr:uncharacterized protein LOC111269015 [Varroa jacobsoni]